MRDQSCVLIYINFLFPSRFHHFIRCVCVIDFPSRFFFFFGLNSMNFQLSWNSTPQACFLFKPPISISVCRLYITWLSYSLLDKTGPNF